MRVRYKPVCCGDEFKKSYSFKEFFKSHLTSFILLFSVITLTSLYLGGILAYLFEEDFTNYSYPLNNVDVRDLVERIDRFQLDHQQKNLIFGINTVNYDSIVEAVESIKAEGGLANRIIPLTQFKDFNFSIDIKPTCRQQWGVSQIKNTLLSLSSQQHLMTVIIVVKSAVNNYARRQAIRNTWYLNQTRELFSFKTVFMVGKCHEQNTVPSHAKLSLNNSWSADDCNEKISGESSRFGDIIQSSGIDSYYNNTIKTYMTLRWLNERCPADFNIAIDDDYVFEVDNFISFMYDYASEYLPPPTGKLTNASLVIPQAGTSIPDPNNVPGSIAQPTSTTKDRRHLATIEGSSLDMKQLEVESSYATMTLESQVRNLIALRRLSKQYVWAGYVRNYVHPLRSVLSKWYISRDDYAFNKYPRFITGGYVLMSFKTVKHLYYATYFTRSFKFDDVYLGILAHKLGLSALHSDKFMCYLDDYLSANPTRPNSTECIGVHDIEPNQLQELWQLRER